MAVRFLPVSPEEGDRADDAQSGVISGDASRIDERGDLAEVIDLRTRFARSWASTVDSTDDSDSASEATVGADSDDTSQEAVSADGVRLLARRARSAGELRRELVALGHAALDADAVILEFERSLYLDDLGLARVTAEGLRERKRASRAQIRVKLRERLLPDGIIEQVLGEFGDDEEHELLLAAAEDRARRLTGLDRQTAERRLLGFLARRGWSGERATRAAREALDAHAGPASQVAGGRGPVRFR